MILTDEDLHHLLALEPGERVVSVWPEPLMDGIAIGIEGDETTSLPETDPGSAAYRIERPYAMAKLRDRLAHIVATMRRHDSREAYHRAIGELVEKEIFPHLGIVVPPADVP